MDEATTQHDDGEQRYSNRAERVERAVQVGVVQGDMIVNPVRVDPVDPPGPPDVPGSPGSARIRRMVLAVAATVLVIAVTVTLVFVLRRPVTNDAAVDSGPPVLVVVQNHVLPASGGAVWALPGVISPPHATITVGPQLAGLVNGRPSAQLGGLSLSLVLRGQYTQDVQVTGLRAVIVEHTAPLDGTLLYAPAQGTVDAVDGCVYLGDPVPAIRLANPADASCDPAGKSFFADHAVQLGPDEQKVINISILPKSGYYEFQLVLDVVAGDKSMEIPVSGSPFRVTTYAPTYKTIYAAPDPDHANVLAPVDPAAFCPHGCTSGPNG